MRRPSLRGRIAARTSLKRVVRLAFGWGKVVGTIRKVKVRGLRRVSGLFTFALAAYNIVRIRNLIKATA